MSASTTSKKIKMGKVLKGPPQISGNDECKWRVSGRLVISTRYFHTPTCRQDPETLLECLWSLLQPPWWERWNLVPALESRKNCTLNSENTTHLGVQEQLMLYGDCFLLRFNYLCFARWLHAASVCLLTTTDFWGWKQGCSANHGRGQCWDLYEPWCSFL